MADDTFENLLSRGLELTVRYQYPTGYLDRLAVVKITVTNHHYYLTIKFNHPSPNLISYMKIPMSEIRVILATNSMCSETGITVPLLQLARHPSKPISLGFPSSQSRNKFAKLFEIWLSTIGIQVKVLTWL